MSAEAIILKFVNGIEKVAKDLLKSVLIDCSLHKYKPSILAATLLFVGFQLQFLKYQKLGLAGV